MTEIPKKPITHPLWLRITHWLNAIAVIVMIMSGWQIYNASPIFPFRFPHAITLGGWLAGAIQWHFAAMWLLVANSLIYLTFGFLTGHIQQKFFPVHFSEMLKEFWLALRFKLKHKDLTHYNMLQKMAYIVAILDLIVIVCSGLVVWKSVQFPLLRDLLGDYDTARLIHFIAMSIMIGFIGIHVALVAIVPRTLWGMIRGKL
jgi:thiosulfate reductase cytochrome b subunit